MTSNIYYIGLSAWIIQDGNYGDFKVGQKSSFALEFYPVEQLHPADPSSMTCATRKSDSTYGVTGKVINKSNNWWAIDIGVHAFQEQNPKTDLCVDDYFNGRIWLGIDPFFYFESISKNPSAPPLIYDWRVKQIFIQTAPFVEIEPKHMARDEHKLGWESVKKTDAWQDDNGHGDYLLKCELLSETPRRERR